MNFTKSEKKSEKTPALKPAEISDLPPSISLRLFKEELEKSKYHSKKGKKNLLTKRISIPISRFLLQVLKKFLRSRKTSQIFPQKRLKIFTR